MKKKLSLFLALTAFAALSFASQAAAESCRTGIHLCVELIIPSLFPFFVLSMLLNKMGLPSLIGHILAPAAARLYGISGAGASALIVGLLGGYPAGAAYIAEMTDSSTITRNEGERLLAFCNNSGPAFIIGAVGGGIFRSAKIGFLLYGIHVLAAIITGLFFRSHNYIDAEQPLLIDSIEPVEALIEAVKQAVSTLISVCGFILFFTVLTGIMDAAGFLPMLCGKIAAAFGFELHFVRAMLMGILEIGSAVGAMRGLKLTAHSLALAAFIVGWGGISVHMQSYAVIHDRNMKGTLHMAGRLINASISALLAFVIGTIIIS